MEILANYLNAISPLQEATLQELSSYFRPLKLKKKEYFVSAGTYTSQIGFLKKGVVRAYFHNQEGKEYTKQFFTDHSLIGAYSALLTQQTNKIAQQALTDCDIWVADYTTFVKLYDTHPDIERLGRKIAENYFLEKEEKELEMALFDAEKRYELFRQRFPQLENQIPQYYIASYLSISPTQLSRIRKKLYQN